MSTENVRGPAGVIFTESMDEGSQDFLLFFLFLSK